MDDRLVDERLRLSAAREQLETARTREEELLNELQIMHASQVVTEMGQITEGDVNDLKAAFKKDLEDVLGFVREFSQPTAAQEETAETALEESEDEEAVAENLGDFRQVVAAAVKSLSGKQLKKLLENPEATVTWPSKDGQVTEATFRLSEGCTFLDLKACMMFYLGLPRDDESLERMELFDGQKGTAWPGMMRCLLHFLLRPTDSCACTTHTLPQTINRRSRRSVAPAVPSTRAPASSGAYLISSVQTRRRTPRGRRRRTRHLISSQKRSSRESGAMRCVRSRTSGSVIGINAP